MHALSKVFRYAPSVFLVVMFIGLPAAWALDRHDRLPHEWAPAIAEGPVVACMAVGFVWRDSKKLYLWARSDNGEDGLTDEHRWYWEFFDQVPEHKEMLVAVALLMYAIYRVRTVRRLASRS